MPSSLRVSELGQEYLSLCALWQELPEDARAARLMGFAVNYAYNSGKIENEAITLHDTREVFERGGVSSFTGEVRTLFEIENLRVSWNWMLEQLSPGAQGFSFDERELLACHRMLTQGTYDERRWSLGERPGTYKRHAFGVSDAVGYEPEDVPEAVEDLLVEVRAARGREHDAIGSLTIAAYLHAGLVDIHPFADGNGRLARQLVNMQLMSDGLPPVLVPEGDRMAYYGALDAFHYEDELLPLEEFLVAESVRLWRLRPDVSDGRR